MSIFTESSWEGDAVGDKLSKQIFPKKKKGKKDGKKQKHGPGSIISLPKTDKICKNISSDNIKGSAKYAKLKSKKKKSPPNSIGNEESASSGPRKVKSLANVQSLENGTISAKPGKLKAKKRKRSLSNSVQPEESPPKKTKLKPGQDKNSENSKSPKMTKKNKNLKNRSKEVFNVPNKKSFLSKKDKTVINKKTNQNNKSKKCDESPANLETKSQRKRKKQKLKKMAQALRISSSNIELNLGQKHDEKSVGKSLDVQKLEQLLALKDSKLVEKSKVNKEPESLRSRMMTQLRASRFRFLNETLYNNESSESKKYFKEDPDAFAAYHSGYRQQVEQWPLNPLDVIISSIKKMPKDYVIADFGCGEARLAESVTQKVHSFDLVAINDRVKACDMAHTPLLTNGVNIVVFCLSLMGTNLADYLLEANRVLKTDGILKIADVESRFENVDEFINLLGSYGFVNTWKDLSHNLFYFMDFKKTTEVNRKTKNLPEIALKPCLYKKR